jgi:hypothetical protein
MLGGRLKRNTLLTGARNKYTMNNHAMAIDLQRNQSIIHKLQKWNTHPEHLLVKVSQPKSDFCPKP